MAETSELYRDFVPELGNTVWLKREVVFKDTELVEGSQREMLWVKLSWSDSDQGPWTFLTWLPHAFNDPEGQ